MKDEKKKGGAVTLAKITKEIVAGMNSGTARMRPLPAPTQLVNFSLDFRRIVAENETLRAEVEALRRALETISRPL